MNTKKPLIERFQQLAGIIPLYEEAPENRDQMAGLLLKTLQQNKPKVMMVVGDRLKDFDIDSLDDVSTTDIDGSTGYSFRLAADIDSEFVGQEGELAQFFDLNGVKIAYISYNL